MVAAAAVKVDEETKGRGAGYGARPDHACHDKFDPFDGGVGGVDIDALDSAFFSVTRPRQGIVR